MDKVYSPVASDPTIGRAQPPSEDSTPKDRQQGLHNLLAATSPLSCHQDPYVLDDQSSCDASQKPRILPLGFLFVL